MSTSEYKMTWEEAVNWLKSQPEKSEIVKACYYDDPLEAAANRFYREDEWQSTKELLPSKKGSALDIGSGRGISAYALAKDGWKVTALEPNTSSVVGAGAIKELAESTGTNIEVVSEWGESLPFESASFDLVHARQVLHHAHDLEKFCKEVYRVTKPSGTFIATREHVIDSHADKDKFLASHPLHYLYGGENAFLLDEYKSALRKAGFRIDKVLSPFETPINYFPMKRADIVEMLFKKIAGKNISRKLNSLVPEFFLRFVGDRLIRTPGRLYTFVAVKDGK